jgi:hypothetical protein
MVRAVSLLTKPYGGRQRDMPRTVSPSQSSIDESCMSHEMSKIYIDLAGGRQPVDTGGNER